MKVSNMVNGRCPGCDYINPVETLQAYIVPFGYNVMCYIGLFTDAIFISAWALTLSVQLDLAMQEPWYVGRTTGRFHAFFVSISC